MYMQQTTAKQHSDMAIPVTKLTYNTGTSTYTESKDTPKFIKGPIPFKWQQAANALPGKAGLVGLALWFLFGIKKSKNIKITAEAMKFAGCTRQTFASGLRALEVAGLIAVERKSGKKPTVKIIQ